MDQRVGEQRERSREQGLLRTAFYSRRKEAMEQGQKFSETWSEEAVKYQWFSNALAEVKGNALKALAENE